MCEKKLNKLLNLNCDGKNYIRKIKIPRYLEMSKCALPLNSFGKLQLAPGFHFPAT